MSNKNETHFQILILDLEHKLEHHRTKNIAYLLRQYNPLYHLYLCSRPSKRNQVVFPQVFFVCLFFNVNKYQFQPRDVLMQLSLHSKSFPDSEISNIPTVKSWGFKERKGQRGEEGIQRHTELFHHCKDYGLKTLF